MRLKLFKILTTILLVILGGGLLVVALFATQLGLDSSANMGSMRRQLAAFAVVLLLLPLLAFLLGRLERLVHFTGWLRGKVKSINEFFEKKQPPQGTKGTRRRLPDWAWGGLAVLLVALVSLWYLSGGKMTQLTPYSRFYDMQADAFLAGSTALLEEPPAQLAELADPYDWQQREGFTYLWDATYFNGKYFLYWGPVPALLASALKLARPMVVEDQVLVLLFVVGLAAVFAALLSVLRKRFSPSAPGWTVFAFTLMSGFSTPVFWLVNRPSVYEAAIAACQFFLFLGLYAVVKGLLATRRQWAWMLLAGITLGAAVGSRASVLFVVLLLFAVTAWQFVKRLAHNRVCLASLAALTLPLAAFAVGLAWFNYARFGSVFETGLRYQLTGNFMGGEETLLYSAWYVVPNLILALLQPFKNTAEFPFLKAVSNPHWGGMIRAATHNYNVEPSSGILRTLPVLYVLLLPAIRVWKRFWCWLHEKPASSASASPLPRWLWVMLIGGPALAFAVTVSFMMKTMRYLADFVPLLLLLTAVLTLSEIERYRGRVWQRKLLLATLVVLGLAGVMIGLLINFTNTDLRFMNINPVLFEQLSGWFG
jgi:hypothetical protein